MVFMRVLLKMVAQREEIGGVVLTWWSVLGGGNTTVTNYMFTALVRG